MMKLLLNAILNEIRKNPDVPATTFEMNIYTNEIEFTTENPKIFFELLDILEELGCEENIKKNDYIDEMSAPDENDLEKWYNYGEIEISVYCLD